MVLGFPGLALAHPHIFVATGLTPVVSEDGRLTGIEVTWRYDAFYSLLVLEDMGLDSDHDGVLTAAELARLDGFDMQWIEGYAGDLFVHEGARALELGPPEPRRSAFEDGMITTSHFRAIKAAGKGPFMIQAYDPTYYTAYDLGLGVGMANGCTAEVIAPDIGAAETRLKAELAKLPKDAELNFPEVGDVFAEKVMLRCGADS
jgi:ABC-type uncharacterized transport system substrate-binding protein